MGVGWRTIWYNHRTKTSLHEINTTYLTILLVKISQLDAQSLRDAREYLEHEITNILPLELHRVGINNGRKRFGSFPFLNTPIRFKNYYNEQPDTR